jgi:general stress protein CsbA
MMMASIKKNSAQDFFDLFIDVKNVTEEKIFSLSWRLVFMHWIMIMASVKKNSAQDFFVVMAIGFMHMIFDYGLTEENFWTIFYYRNQFIHSIRDTQ